jgi:protein-histidine pros-kinase
MSHELRTPLNAIIGFTSTLLMRLPGPLNAEQEHQLGTIQTSARHLHSLINDLLDLAKIEAGKVELNLEPVACRAVLEEVEALLRPAAVQKGLELRLKLPVSGTVVHADRRALTQILLNLTNNAIKFTDQGSVQIECRQWRRTASVTSTVFAVQDTGVGIAASDQVRLFESFQQLRAAGSRRQDGAGLGLHLSQRLDGLMGGRIVCESELGGGSRFAFELEQGVSE